MTSYGFLTISYLTMPELELIMNTVYALIITRHKFITRTRCKQNCACTLSLGTRYEFITKPP